MQRYFPSIYRSYSYFSLQIISKRYLFKDKNPISNIAKEVDKLSKNADLQRDMTIGTGTLVATDVFKNPSLKVVNPQSISPPTMFPSNKLSSFLFNLKFKPQNLDKILKNDKTYKLLIVIEKRQIGFFLTNKWRAFINKKFPNIPVLELILVHQLTQICFFPVLYLAYISRLEKNAISSTFCHIGPCRHFMKEIRLQNPYIPNVYLIDKNGKAVWISSSGPTEEDLKQLTSLTKHIKF